ncbi:MAG: hypothetical protein OEZ04_07635, partial [Nitrospinota bacterium]|nr:hypothetical protein [Nitrospinota bacterium]
VASEKVNAEASAACVPVVVEVPVADMEGLAALAPHVRAIDRLLLPLIIMVGQAMADLLFL